ncbi:hypothetical protein Agub_g991 [Astrephomene gubernaculifera]|uniref:Uncharacterized protein n=1 Tax=Astrephomene gubernaculifera TaxID=47775 RepID=A0AAD3HGX3_9CHLO|nr:hypothetical protein Agub_g991 [Astrephomene gubernaculifera]
MRGSPSKVSPCPSSPQATATGTPLSVCVAVVDAAAPEADMPCSPQPAKGSDAFCMPQSESDSRRVNLRSAVLDTYEYHGLTYLAARLAFWALVVGAFFSTYTREQIVNSANMVDKLTRFGPAGQERIFKDQTTMGDAVAYIFDLRSSLFGGTSPPTQAKAAADPSGGQDQVSMQQLALGDYSRLGYMRLVLDLDSNCRYPSLPCYLTDNATLASKFWNMSTTNAPSFLYASNKLFSAVLYSNTTPGSATTAADRFLQLSVDADFVAKYAFKIALEVVCDYSIFPNRYAWVALTAHRSTLVPNDPRLDDAVSVYTATLDLSGDRPFAPWSVLLVSVVLLLTLAYSGVLVRSIWLYDLQRMHDWRDKDAKGTPGMEPRRKAGWARTLATFFTYSLWNSLELLALLLCLLWCCVYMYGIYAVATSAYSLQPRQPQSSFGDESDFNRLLYWGCLVSFWYEVGSFTILLNGLSLYPYFRVHRGMRLYLYVLSAVWKAIVNFVCFFAFAFLLIGFFCLASTQLPGIQPDLTYPATAFAALSKLMFGFYSYDEFVNSTVPKTALMASMQDAVFWISIIMLYIFVQNILLAIVAIAYDEAKAREAPAEATFPFTVFVRLLWYPVMAYYRLYRRMSLHQMLSELDTWPSSTFTLYFRRWALACTSEAQALQAYYTYYCNWHFKPRSPWLYDPFKIASAAYRQVSDLPPHSVGPALTRAQLQESLRALGATPSFQRLCALRLPWPLHRVRAYQWHERSLDTLMEMVWGVYSYEEEAAAGDKALEAAVAAVLMRGGGAAGGAAGEAEAPLRRGLFARAARAAPAAGYYEGAR